VNIVGGKAGAVGLDQESANLTALILDFGKDNGHVGDGSGGDQSFSPLRMYSSPTLRAVVVMAPGLEPAPGSVGRSSPVFRRWRERKPGVLLLVGAEGVDGVHDQAGLHADKAAEAGVAAFQLLHHQAVFDVGHAGAAVAFEVGAEEAQFAHDGDQLARKTLRAKSTPR